MAAMPSLYILLLLPLLCSISAASDEDAETVPMGHLKPFGAQGPSSGIDQVDGFISPEEFLTKYAMQNRPLLFKRAAKVSPAFTKWTDAYLMQRTPPRPAGDVHIEHNKKENRSQKYSYVHFKEFLTVYNTSDIYMVSSVPEFLLEDLVVPFPLQCKYFRMGGLDTHVAWFSNGGTSSVIHHDSYENVNCLLRGRKSLVFLNVTKYADQVEKLLDVRSHGYSSVDVDKIDVKARPEFAGLEFQTADMEAGDCLYIPLYWVHQVRSFDNNLAVNLWWPGLQEYDLSDCSEKFDTSLRFNRVYFGSHMRIVRNDTNAVRDVMASRLPNPASEAALLSLLSNGNSNGVTASWPQFPTLAMSLFKTLDLNKDGLLTVEELKQKLRLKVAKMVIKIVTIYNVKVFAMHEAAATSADLDKEAAAGRLPKLFAISGSDKSVYAPDRTWSKLEAVDETKDTEGEKDGVKDAKDEL